MSLPYFPLYPKDFEAKTAHLTLEEDGAYNRLLRLCWLTPGCSLPDDPAWIARRLRVDAATYDRIIAPLIAEFFKRTKGRVWQHTLTEIYHETNEKHSRRVEAGRLGGRPPKCAQNKDKGKSNAKAMPKQPEPEPEPDKKEREVNLSRANDRFDEFWAIVPRRVKKDTALAAYTKALRKVDAETIIQGMARYAESRRGQDPQYTAHPTSWLNAGRWADEQEPPTGVINGNSKGERRLRSWIAGASVAPPVDSWPDTDTSQPLLARR